MKAPRFDVYQDKRGLWRWRLLAANGRTVADGGEGYSSKSSVRRAIQTARELAILANVGNALRGVELDTDDVVVRELTDNTTLMIRAAQKKVH